jgi:uncharacterized repeat protein (TIGR03803 family)
MSAQPRHLEACANAYLVIFPQEESMNSNTRLVTLSEVLLIILTLVVAPGAWAQGTYKSLHKFPGKRGWSRPVAGLIFDQSGNLYSTTSNGGNASSSGTVFKLTQNAGGRWTEVVLYSFCSANKCADGASPDAGLIFDATGNLYGTTFNGGANQGGVVFKLAPNSDGSWTESVLYTFCSLTNCSDGSSPDGNLIFDQSGNLYGTTYTGGVSDLGTVFKLAPNSDGSWTESVLHSFAGGTDGGLPAAGLIFDAAGNLYGTSGYAVFKLKANSNGSWTESVLYSLDDRSFGGLLFDQEGNLYGTTVVGGTGSCFDGTTCGVVFKLEPKADGSWKENVIHNFRGEDGAHVLGGLTIDQAGSLYGTTEFGGHLGGCSGQGCGVVFKLTPDSNGGWHETPLWAFGDDPGGCPYAGVILDAAGNLYGTTGGDGGNTFGSVFEITP